MSREIERNIVIEAQFPDVFRVAGAAVARARLLDGEIAAHARIGVTKFRFPGRDVIGEIGVHQFRRTAIYLQLTGAHLEIHTEHLGLVEVHRLSFVPGRTDGFRIEGAACQQRGGSNWEEEFEGHMPPGNYNAGHLPGVPFLSGRCTMSRC